MEDILKEILKIADRLLFLSKCGFEKDCKEEFLVFLGLVRDCAFKIKKFSENSLREELKRKEVNMGRLKGTRTEKNILTAFAGESQARNRYTYFASKAKKEGYVKIAKIFEETANQEKEHAERLFKLLEGGEVEITATFPAGVIGSTLENLKAAANGENYEHTTMYPEFAKIAREEGFEDIALIFEAIAVAERYHEKRYKELLKQLEEGTVFKREEEKVWRCQNCGYLHKGKEAPEKCPACAHPRDYFEVLGEVADPGF